MHATHFVYDTLGPIEILTAVYGPIRRRHGDDIAQIADLVRQLDELGMRAKVASMFDLQTFALAFGKVLSSVTSATIFATS